MANNKPNLLTLLHNNKPSNVVPKKYFHFTLTVYFKQAAAGVATLPDHMYKYMRLLTECGLPFFTHHS